MMGDEELQQHAEGLDSILRNHEDNGGSFSDGDGDLDGSNDVGGDASRPHKASQEEIEMMATMTNVTITDGNGNSRSFSYNDDNDDGNDDDRNDEDYDDEDLAPLIRDYHDDSHNTNLNWTSPRNDTTLMTTEKHQPPSSPRQHQRRRRRYFGSYLARQLAAAVDEDDQSCWKRIRGLLAQLSSIVLFLVAISVILYPTTNTSDSNNHDASTTDGNSDQCMAIMNMSIDEFMDRFDRASMDVANKTTYNMTDESSDSARGWYSPDAAFCDDNDDDGDVKNSNSNGGDCRCPSPLLPTPRTGTGLIPQLWQQTFERNKFMAMKTAATSLNDLDVVFLGDSITEHWTGTDLNRTSYDQLYKDKVVFSQNFGGSQVNAPLHGLALGIGGDKCENLLYRLQNGELPSTLESKVYWVLIGTNDLMSGCSADTIVAGTIRIAQELIHHRQSSGSTIVLNSILPRAGATPKKPEINVFRDKDRYWSTIQKVNDRLKCYADSTRGVQFFNATDFFVTSNGDGIQKYFDDAVHPSPQGYKHWAEGIVECIQHLIH